MKKVTEKNKNFKIIPEANIVKGKTRRKYVCDELHGIKLLHRNVIWEALMKEDNSYDTKCFVPYYDSIDLEAYAYCDRKDEFDEQIGLNVCAEKLDYKQHINLARQCARAYRVLMESADYLYKKCQFHLGKAQAIQDDLADTYGRMKV